MSALDRIPHDAPATTTIGGSGFAGLQVPPAATDGWKMLLYKEVLRFWRVAFPLLFSYISAMRNTSFAAIRNARLRRTIQTAVFG